MAASVAPPQTGEQSQKTASSPSAVVVQVLAAVATGVGVLGFVTFFGGAILWIRAREAGLAASDVVAVIPKPVLVTTGASFLVPAVLLAVSAVGLIYGVHLVFRSVLIGRSKRQAFAAAQLRRTAQRKTIEARSAESRAAQARAREDTTRTDYAVAHRASRDIQAVGGSRGEPLDERGASLHDARAHESNAQAAAREAAAVSLEAAELGTRADLAEANVKLDRTTTPGWRKKRQAFECIAAFLALVVAPVAFEREALSVHLAQAMLLSLLVLLVWILSAVTYLTTERFAWFGLVSFVGVGVFIGAATYVRIGNELKVEAAAALRTGRPPVRGWFVAQTSDNLYLGTLEEDAKARRLVIIPGSQVKDLAIGPLLDVQEAGPRSVKLALKLCAQDTTKAPAMRSKEKPTQACTQRQIDALTAVKKGSEWSEFTRPAPHRAVRGTTRSP